MELLVETKTMPPGAQYDNLVYLRALLDLYENSVEGQMEPSGVPLLQPVTTEDLSVRGHPELHALEEPQ